jgi:hypothetical protein
MFAVALVILFAWAAAPDSVERLTDFVGFLDDHAEDNGSRIILTLGGLVVALLALVVVIAELTPGEAGRVPVRDVQAGDVLLSTDAIAQRLHQALSAVPHVTQAKATVTARGKAVEVDLELHVDPDTNLASTSEEVCRTVEDLVGTRLSVEMARPPRLNLRYSELRLAQTSTGAAQPAPPPPPLSEESPVEAEEEPPPSAAEEGEPSTGETPPETEGEDTQAETKT